MSSSPSTRSQTIALKVLALVALVTILWIAQPVGVGLFLGVLLAFTLQPLYGALRARNWSANRAALLCVIGAMVLVAGAVVGMAALFVARGVGFLQALPALLAPDGELRRSAARLLTAVQIDPEAQFAGLEREATSLGSRAAGLATDVAGATITGFLTLLFMGVASFYVLRHWDDIVRHAELTFPFERRHTRALFGQFRTVGTAVLRGTVLTGVAQGLLAGLGYWITGVPDPAFFGALTAVASIVPAVGAVLVWVPIGIYLLATGHVANGIIELVYSALVVGVLVDYVIRPKLVRSGTGVPTVLTFVSLLGGVQVFGLIGLIVGPVIVTLCVAILKTYEAEVVATQPV
jgi:predicted PurR-regulated permease PerM